MNSPVKSPSSPSISPYVWATVIIALVTVVMIVVILWLRPIYDPLVVLASAGGFFTMVSSAVASLLKSQEAVNLTQDTHEAVNSRFDAVLSANTQKDTALGVLQGVAQEQNRVASIFSPAAQVPIVEVIKEESK